MSELQPRNRPTLGLPVKEDKPETQVSAPRRQTRVPFGALDMKLAYPDREGYHRHWFNDVAGRIDRALKAGYEHVKDKEGKNVTRLVGTAEGGGGLHAFLMEIPQEWYEEDMAREQAQVNEREASIKRGAPQGAEVERGYIPSQGISIR